MQVSSYCRATTTVTLESHEGWEVANEAGRPFWVRQVLYFGGADAHLEGWAIKVDGSSGAIQRRALVDISALPIRVFHQMRISYNDSIRQLHTTIKDSVL